MCYSPAVEATISNAIEPVQYFVNHKAQLEDLSNKLSLYRTAGLLGISGIGKTQLARMYIRQNQKRYKLIWVFDTNTDLNESFVTLADTMNKQYCHQAGCHLPTSQTLSQKAVLEYLAPRNDWLLVFDNIKINQNTKLDHIIKWSHNGHVILCSQDSKNLPQAIQVPHLTQNDSIKVVNTILNNQDTTLVNELTTTFKGYPFLVAQAALFLSDNNYMSVEEYKNVIAQVDNKVKYNIELVLHQLPNTARNLLYKVAVINNHMFSKHILKIIANDEKNFSQDVYNLTRFSIMINTNNTQQMFEMHDMIKDIILDNMSEKEKRQTIENVIDALNHYIPSGVATRYKAIIEDESLKSNLEAILVMAEKHHVNTNKIIELRKNLMDFYIFSLDYHNCEKMEQWFLNKRGGLRIWLMNDAEKANYAEYLAIIGTYEHFAKANFVGSIKFLEEAREIIGNTQLYPELRFTIYSQLAQTHVFSGNISSTKENLKVVSKIIQDNPKANIDGALFDFINAKLSLIQGHYTDSLVSMKRGENEWKNLPQDTFTAPAYILHAEILNYMEKFKEAYDISNKVYIQEVKSIGEDHEIIARALGQLSRAEAGLGLAKKALQHSIEAKEMYLHTVDNAYFKDAGISTNVELASVLVSEGNALGILKKYEEAAKSYSEAEAIYFNVYRNNMGNVDEVSYLYYNAALVMKEYPDKFWYNKFSNSLFEKFGRSHPRSQKLLLEIGSQG